MERLSTTSMSDKEMACGNSHVDFTGENNEHLEKHLECLKISYDHARRIENHYETIVDQLGEIDKDIFTAIVTFVSDKGCLSIDQCQHILHTSATQNAKIRQLLTIITNQVSEAAFHVFLQALNEYFPPLYNDLKDEHMAENTGLPGIVKKCIEALKQQNIETVKTYNDPCSYIPVEIYHHKDIPTRSSPKSSERWIEAVKVNDIFKLPKESHQCRKPIHILIGLPGSGKKKFCHEIVKNHANNDLWENFNFVFLIQWTEACLVKDKVSFPDLLFGHLGPSLKNIGEKQAVWHYLHEHQNKVLFILYGYKMTGECINHEDEQKPAKIRTWLCNLMKRNILPGCEILLTSRCHILDHIDSFVDPVILEQRGFSEDKVEQMIDHQLDGQPATKCKLKQHLRDHPNIARLCLYPLYIQGLLDYLKQGDDIPDEQRLPRTLARLLFVLETNVLQNHSHMAKGEHSSKSSLQILRRHKKIIKALAELAYKGFDESCPKEIFNEEDLEYHQLDPKEVEESGLMNTYHKSGPDALKNETIIVKQYMFPDNIVQEFFATLELSSHGLSSILKKVEANDGQYDTMIQLIVGMYADPKCQDLLRTLSLTDISTWNPDEDVKDIVKAVFKSPRRFHKYGPVLCICIFAESQQYRTAAYSLQDSDLLATLATPFLSFNIWDTDISSTECDQIAHHIQHVTNTVDQVFGEEMHSGEVLLRSSRIDSKCMASLLKSGCPGVSIIGQYNVKAIYDIAKALCNNSSLQRLAFWGNSELPCTASHWKMLDVRENCTLKCWGLAYGMIENKGAFQCMCEKVTCFKSLDTFSIVMTNLSGCLSALHQLSHVRHLILFDCKLSSTDIDDVDKFMYTAQSLQYVDLSHNFIGDQGAFKLADCLCSNRSLKALRLETCGLQDEGIKRICLACTDHPNLHILHLDDNKICFEGAEALTSCLKNLHELSIKSCDMTESAKKRLSAGLQDSDTISFLDVSSLNIGSETMALLAKSHLHALSLGDSGINEDVLLSICDVLKDNRSLQLLDISGNPISANGIQKLISTSKVEHLAIVNCNIDITAAEDLGKMLTGNNHLKSCLMGFDGEVNDKKEEVTRGFLEGILEYPSTGPLRHIMLCGRKDMLATTICSLKKNLPSISVNFVVDKEPFFMLSGLYYQEIPKVMREWLVGTYGGID